MCFWCSHERRRILHFAVTAHPTAEWSVQQLREAFPWDTAPRYLLRDRDRIFSRDFVDQVKAMGIKEFLSAPRSPWQRATSNGSSEPFAVSVWTMSSYPTNEAFTDIFEISSITIIELERTWDC